MPIPQVFELSLLSFTADQLAIKVKNIRGASLDQTLTIELYPPTYLVDKRLKEASDKAAVSQSPPGVASLGSVVTGPEGWSVWAKAELSNHIAVVMLVNDMDQSGRETTPVPVAAGAEFTIRIPLNPQANRATVDLLYSYKYGEEDTQNGKLELKSSDTTDWVPEVTLTTDHRSPTMINPGTDVKVFWHIKDGVSATLRGPLPGGNSEWTLSSSTTSNFRLSDGFFQIKAVGPMIYTLEAEVKRQGKPNVQIVRSLSLDVYTHGKYAYVSARPNRVLPYGLVEIDWAAWGVQYVVVDVGGATRKIPLTEMTLSGDFQGIGVVRVNAGRPSATDEALDTTVDLDIEIESKLKTEASTKFRVVPWRKMLKSEFTGTPIGLAVAAPHMALLSTDGLWIANVGDDDFTPINYNQVQNVRFNRAAQNDKPKAWLALAALDKKFVVLRRTDQDDLQVALYNSDGKPDEVLPIDLPADLRPLVGRGGTDFDLAVYGGRSYVVVEAILPGSIIRRAFSVAFDSKTKKAEFRNEPRLENMPGSRLMTFDETLYALNREFGHMFRFALTADGKLEQSYKAASAVNQSGGRPSSMVKQGLLVPVGRVLAVLGPSSLPSLKSLEVFGLKNILKYTSLTPLKDPSTIPQDVVYNPQHNYWARCGHGLEIKAGAVCAFRGGNSQRLWVIGPDGETHTLAVSSEHLFSHDFVTNLPPKPLPPYLNKQRQFAIKNNTGMSFVPLNETCHKAGLHDFSSNGPAEIISPFPNRFTAGTTQTFELRYNETDPAAVTLRFLAERGKGVKHDYLLELTFSGPDFSTLTSGFKRLAVDAQGSVSIAEIPGSSEQLSTAGPISLSGPHALIGGIRLRVRNATTYKLWQRLWLRTPEGKDHLEGERNYDEEVIKILYNTQPFSIYAHGAGELFFDVDFALPHGIEVTPGNVVQRKRIRINSDKSTGLSVESPSFQETDAYDVYECRVRYKVQKNLEAVYIGDGAPSADGGSIYLPVGLPIDARQVQVWKIDAQSLAATPSLTFAGGGVFSTPNRVAVLKERVVAIFGNSEILSFQHSLELKNRVGIPELDAITNLRGDPTDEALFLLGLKADSRSNPSKYSYRYVAKSFANGQYSGTQDISLDAQKGFRPARVPGAPGWVSPTTISPMDTNRGLMVAVCVEGGLIVINVAGGKTIQEVGLEGTGREEAVLFDPKDPYIYCAHSTPNNHDLMISHVRTDDVHARKTITLPKAVADMATDTSRIPTPALEYKHHRAVSLALPGLDTLFVAHGQTIYSLDKRTLNVRESFTVDLPCRFLQVRQGKPTTDKHPHYGLPADCFIIWAIGASYTGDGKKVDQYKTQIYKIGVSP